MRSLRNGNFIKWFYFGMHIKRWLLLVLLGIAIMGLGFGYVLREAYATYTFPTWVYGASRLGVPPHVNVWGTVLFTIGILVAVANLVTSGRSARKRSAMGSVPVATSGTS